MPYQNHMPYQNQWSICLIQNIECHTSNLRSSNEACYRHDEGEFWIPAIKKITLLPVQQWERNYHLSFINTFLWLISATKSHSGKATVGFFLRTLTSFNQRLRPRGITYLRTSSQIKTILTLRIRIQLASHRMNN